MSLPSQSSRNATRSSQVHYRRSRSGPARKAFTLVVIVGLVALAWFLFIRPRANQIAARQHQTDSQPAVGPIDQSAPTDPAPVTIHNSARPLPGAGDRLDPNDDVTRVLSNQSEPVARSNPAPALPAPNTDILASAANQGNTPTDRPTERNSSGSQYYSNNPAGIRLQLDAASRLVNQNDRVGARVLLSQTLLAENTTHAQAQTLRDELTAINQTLLFSPVADPKDPMSETYKVQSGDSLSKIAARRELATHWKLIARINQIANPSNIRLGQSLKLVRGPFHAVVHKSAHRMDIFHGSPSNPESWIYIKSYDVGLGLHDGTPVGEFVVSANKLENPGWVNPRDAREQYAPNDPDNPIGEYWIGITGVGQYSSLTSLGIHGTIDPDSIGSDESMGCVRLADGDIDVVYELLAEHISRVLIVP